MRFDFFCVLIEFLQRWRSVLRHLACSSPLQPYPEHASFASSVGCPALFAAQRSWSQLHLLHGRKRKPARGFALSRKLANAWLKIISWKLAA